MAPNDPSIRLMDVAGSESIDHARKLFHAYAGEYEPLVAEIFDVQDFRSEVIGLPGRYAPPSGCLVLAMQADVPAGCVALRDLGDGTCEMKRLYVVPEYRGRGMGGLLVHEVLKRAEAMGYRKMVLDSLPEMAGALALYRRFGFVETAPYWHHPTAQAVFLEKALSPGDASE